MYDLFINAHFSGFFFPGFIVRKDLFHSLQMNRMAQHQLGSGTKSILSIYACAVTMVTSIEFYINDSGVRQLSHIF